MIIAAIRDPATRRTLITDESFRGGLMPPSPVPTGRPAVLVRTDHRNSLTAAVANGVATRLSSTVLTKPCCDRPISCVFFFLSFSYHGFDFESWPYYGPSISLWGLSCYRLHRHRGQHLQHGPTRFA